MTSVLYLKFLKIHEFYEIFKIRKIRKNSCWHISSNHKFSILFQATTVEWEEWAVDDSCSDMKEQNDIPNDP